jgi:hypothetical protein
MPNVEMFKHRRPNKDENSMTKHRCQNDQCQMHKDERPNDQCSNVQTETKTRMTQSVMIKVLPLFKINYFLTYILHVELRP